MQYAFPVPATRQKGMNCNNSETPILSSFPLPTVTLSSWLILPQMCQLA